MGFNQNIINGQDAVKAQIYDRQIRMWGLEVQKRLQEATVLLVGGSGLAAEVAKNLVLAGVGVDIMDDRPCVKSDSCNFLVLPDEEPSTSVADAMVRSLREMNLHGRVNVKRGDVANSIVPADIVRGYAAVLVVGLPLVQLFRLDEACVDEDVPFFVGVSRGTTGYIFRNLHKHHFTVKEPEQAGSAPSGTALLKEGTIRFTRLERSIFHPWAGFPPRQKTHPLFFAVRASAYYERTHQHFPHIDELQLVRDTMKKIAQDEGLSLEDRHHLPDDELRQFLEGAQELAARELGLGSYLETTS
eukprot:jgi/Botrbrau1/18154/Bobra.53_1s0024.1